MTSEILCGDCEDILRGYPDGAFDAVISDPPYDFPAEKRSRIHRELLRVSKGAVIVFCPPENQWTQDADQYLFWVKPLSTKNTRKSYSRFVEMILVHRRGAWNIGRHWSQYTNVFTDYVEGETNHPYEKPRSMMRRLILNHTHVGDTVLDPFCGSGTTVVSAVESGRVGVGIEMDRERATFAKERLEDTMTVTRAKAVTEELKKEKKKGAKV